MSLDEKTLREIEDGALQMGMHAHEHLHPGEPATGQDVFSSGQLVGMILRLSTRLRELQGMPPRTDFDAEAKRFVPHPDIYAWLGQDELGSGEIGIKQALVPAGLIPLAAIHREKVERDEVREALQFQADRFGKTIRLVRYVAAEVVRVLEPITRRN